MHISNSLNNNFKNTNPKNGKVFNLETQMKYKCLKLIFVSLVVVVSSFANADLITFTPSGTSSVSQGTNLYWDMFSDTTSTSSLGTTDNFQLTNHEDFHFSSGTADMVNIGSSTGGYLFSLGELIGPSSNWSNSSDFIGTTNYSGIMNFGDSGTFGLSFMLAAQVHYGWVSIVEDVGTQSILGWGYETIAGKSIAAGVTSEVPEPSILGIFALGLIALTSRRFKK